ncbi:hypothetical protein METBIDRAFT_10967 [Metschnikowia bicuspidata var. bicuspidata NRRL YB-4993]|uniref:Inheritance of peroxisomes protein 1 n=1 Tax=Metschnikowia bicuspidata var. bicuspidata NRRL YB-4993 TaxID=869754 RepID=A0A1A0HDV1_9ASCO|nr:hypothetical protein METBIDRAFT_10967 [Metschnikowia bicuspidata var. bicuspidata NRRL YB-4993]OBA22072.1 hypothetical protein METBIDRAFT_10967 [Metschnikowia bicuspidata var. bicuspidata NRRL YB-4993]
MTTHYESPEESPSQIPIPDPHHKSPSQIPITNPHSKFPVMNPHRITPPTPRSPTTSRIRHSSPGPSARRAAPVHHACKHTPCSTKTAPFLCTAPQHRTPRPSRRLPPPPRVARPPHRRPSRFPCPATMPGDLCRALSSRAPRRPDRRRKRRPKKRPGAAKTSEPPAGPAPAGPETCTASAPAALVPPEPPLPSPLPPASSIPQPGGLSPRKQTLMRHQTRGGAVREPLFVSEVKEKKKLRGRLPPAPAPGDVLDGKYSSMLAGQAMEEKTLLFTAPLARVVLYHDKAPGSPVRASPGTLLAHGELEIFQLHGGDVTYVACGRSFVYPLLPRLRVLRTSGCDFVLPLANPQRCWKISIDAADAAVGCRLETVLRRVVQYTSLAVPPPGGPGPTLEPGGPPARSPSLHPPLSNDIPGLAPSNDIPGLAPFNDIPGPAPFNDIRRPPLFNDIPESPPSVPASPLGPGVYPPQAALGAPHAHAPLWPLPRPAHRAGLSLPQAPAPRTAAASSALTNPFFRGPPANVPRPDVLPQPAPPRHRPQAAPSETSSMDSLLDAYEEAVSAGRSVQHSPSRPASRGASYVSAAPSGPLQYHRHIRSDWDGGAAVPSPQPTQGPLADGRPPTALARRDRARHTSCGGRSRQSSVSDLYSTTSSWMEPGVAPRTAKLASSRSLHSVSAHAKGPGPNLDATYRRIYRSIVRQDVCLGAGPGLGGAATAPGTASRAAPDTPRSQATGAGRGIVCPGRRPLDSLPAQRDAHLAPSSPRRHAAATGSRPQRSSGS